MTATGRRYAYFTTAPEMRWLWKDLSQEIAKQLDMTPLLLVRSPEDKKFYEQQFGRPFEGEIAIDPDIYGLVLDDELSETEKAENRRRAAEFERKYGSTLLRDFLLAERQYARSYLFGAKLMLRTKISGIVNNDHAIKACLTSIDHYEKIFEKFPPGLVVAISGGNCIMGKPLAIYCKAMDIPFRNMTHSRFGNRYMWAEDEFGNTPAILDAINKFPTPSEDDVTAVTEQIVPTGDVEFYGKMLRRDIQWHRIIYRSAWYFAAYWYRKMRGYTKARTGYLLRDEIWNLVLTRWQWKYLSRAGRPRLSELPDRKLVYFPLQSEPEGSLTALAPYFSNQLATIRELSLSLPSDALLVVKEHPVQMIPRGRDFYESIAALPNVALINVQEPSYDVIKKSDLVVAVTSSAAHEAVVLGRKVAYLSPDGVLHAVPHVHLLRTFQDFKEISRILETDSDEERDRHRTEGARYFLALRELCFDLAGMNQFDRDKVPTEEEISYVARSLIETLGPTDIPQARRAVG